MIDNSGKFYEWADRRIIGLLENMDEELFTKPVPGVDRSVRDMAEHLIVYYDYFLKKDKVEFLAMQENLKGMNKQALLEHWKNAVGEFARGVNKFPEDPVEVQDKKKGKVKVTKEEYLLLYTDHATYHRGQLITLYKAATGSEAVNTDYYEFLISQKN